MNALVLILSLLGLFRHETAGLRCIRERKDQIAADAEAAAARYSVPVAALLAVAYLESQYGCHPRSGGCWGAPVSPQRRGTAGNAYHAAAALAWGYRRCDGSNLQAVSHFRCGRCRCPHLIGYQPEDAVNLMIRMIANATP